MIRTKNYGNIYITTTRFNSDTYKENRTWRKKHNIEGCIYGTPIKMSPLIPLHANTFIIEMNNSNNKINGIGFLLNRPYLKEQIKIYKDNNYNRYIYRGMFRIYRHYIKKKYNNPELKGARGYTPVGIETAVGEKVPDQKEFWHHGPVLTSSHDKNIPKNIKIDEVPDFNSNFDKLFFELNSIGLRVLKVIARSLDLDENYFIKN